MKITSPRFGTVAVFFVVSLCAPQTHSTEESTPFDAATVLHMMPPVYVEMDATNMSSPSMHTPPPPPPKEPKVRVPTPRGPSISERIGQAQSAAAQRAVQQAQNAIRQHVVQQTVYAATKLQRQVAEAHARAYMAALQRSEMAVLERGHGEQSAFTKSDRAEKRLTKTKKTTAKKPEKKKKKNPRRHRTHSRYILIDTVKDKRASPKAKKVVMIWDTHAQALVGNNVYDLTNPPPLGQAIVFETYSAEYVGAGTLIP